MFCEIKNSSSEEISSSLFLFRLFHCFPYVSPSLCFLLFWCFFLLTSLFLLFCSLFFFVFFSLYATFGERMEISLLCVLVKKKKTPFFARFLVGGFFQKKKFLHVLVTLFFESLLSFFLCSASQKT